MRRNIFIATLVLALAAVLAEAQLNCSGGTFGCPVSILKPASDSTTAIQITEANGTTGVVDVDTTNARVGMGTTAPIVKLHAVGSGNATGSPTYKQPHDILFEGPDIQFNDNSSVTAGNVAIFSNSSEGIDRGGTLALGGRTSNGTEGAYHFGIIKGAKENSTNTNADGYLAFGTTRDSDTRNIERMRITSTGNVGIGNTAPASLLSINGPGAAGYTLSVDAGTSRLNARVYMPNVTTAAASQTDALCLNASGEVIADTAACLTSDENLKHGITDLQFGMGLQTDPDLVLVSDAALGTVAMESTMNATLTPSSQVASATALINALRPVNFYFNRETRVDDSGNTINIHEDINHTMQRFGFLAQDVGKLDPRLVRYREDGTTYTVDYMGLIPVLVKALQEANARLDAAGIK